MRSRCVITLIFHIDTRRSVTCHAVGTHTHTHKKRNGFWKNVSVEQHTNEKRGKNETVSRRKATVN